MSDASIPLQARGIPVESPFDVAQRGMGLANLAQTNQLNRARLQEERIKAQNLAQDQADQKAVQDAYVQFPGDFNKVREAIAPKVATRNLSAFDKTVQEHAAGMAKMDQDKINTGLARNTELAKRLNSVKMVKDGDTSPEAVAERAAEWAKQATLAKTGGLDPDNQIPTQYPGDDGLAHFDVLLRGTEKHLADEKARREAQQSAAEEARKKAEEQRKAAKAPAELAEAQTKAEVGARQAAASVLATAETADEYAAHYGNLKPEVARFFPKPESFDPETTPDKIQRLGQTAEQQVTTGLTAEARAAQEEANRERKRHNQAVEATNSARAARERGETANAKAVDRRQWERELNKLKEEEEQAGSLRANLETAIKYGKTYVDDKGNTKAMATASKDEQTTADALMQRMRTQYQTATNRLKRITADKNSLGEQLGQGIGVPTDKIHAALDADLQRVSEYGQEKKPPAKGATPAPGAPPPAPTAPQPKAANAQSWTVGGKTYTQGQTLYNREGKPVKVTGVVNGKIQTQPLEQ